MASPTPERLRVRVVIDRVEPPRARAGPGRGARVDVADNSRLVEQVLAAGHLTDAETVAFDGRGNFADVAACRDTERVLPRDPTT